MVNQNSFVVFLCDPKMIQSYVGSHKKTTKEVLIEDKVSCSFFIIGIHVECNFLFGISVITPYTNRILKDGKGIA